MRPRKSKGYYIIKILAYFLNLLNNLLKSIDVIYCSNINKKKNQKYKKTTNKTKNTTNKNKKTKNKN